MRIFWVCLLLVAAPVMALDSAEITTVQRQLNALGYTITDDEGTVGADTKEALTLFRQDNDIPKRQWLNDELAAFISGRYSEMYTRRGVAVPKPPRIRTGKLGKYCVVTSGKLGLAKTDRKLQLQLGELGYRPGNIEGRFSVETRAAVSSFQLDYDLPVTGKANAKTRKALLRAVKKLRKNRARAERQVAAGS